MTRPFQIRWSVTPRQVTNTATARCLRLFGERVNEAFRASRASCESNVLRIRNVARDARDARDAYVARDARIVPRLPLAPQRRAVTHGPVRWLYETVRFSRDVRREVETYRIDFEGFITLGRSLKLINGS